MSKTESESEFTNRIDRVIINGFTTLAISTGFKLGLFDALAKYTTHKTSHEIAADNGLKER